MLRDEFQGYEFQSTPSAWRETENKRRYTECVCYFNPLPPHGGRRSVGGRGQACWDFNPLPPHGGRHSRREHIRTRQEHFNPLPPHGGSGLSLHGRRKIISIHSLRMEGDCLRLSLLGCNLYFNPLPPHGGRPLPLA